MRFSVATVVCLATLIISANAAAEKDENKARKAKPIRKLMANGKRENKAAEAVDDKVLAEDEGYWERFLQNEVPSITDPPTPSPTGTCDTEVSSQFCVQLIHRNSYVIIIEPSRRKSFFFILIFFRFDSLSLLSHSM